MISLIAAMDTNRLIGSGNSLPWHLPNDLKWFKQTTLNKPVIMGRKTHESIGRPLPKRRNIIISRNVDYQSEGCEVVESLDAALSLVESELEPVVIGGQQIYYWALPHVQRMYLTIINRAFNGDTWFPSYEKDQWDKTTVETHQHVDNESGDSFTYSFIILDRL